MPPLTYNSKIKVYLFLAALGLHCCTQTFSGCGEQGYCLFSVCRLLLQLPWWIIRYRICPQFGRSRFDLWVRKIHWRREWQSTPVFFPGRLHGQRSCKESDTTKQLSPLLLRSMSSREQAQELWVHGLSCGIFQDQELNPCLLH